MVVARRSKGGLYFNCRGVADQPFTKRVRLDIQVGLMAYRLIPVGGQTKPLTSFAAWEVLIKPMIVLFQLTLDFPTIPFGFVFGY